MINRIHSIYSPGSIRLIILFFNEIKFQYNKSWLFKSTIICLPYFNFKLIWSTDDIAINDTNEIYKCQKNHLAIDFESAKPNWQLSITITTAANPTKSSNWTTIKNRNKENMALMKGSHANGGFDKNRWAFQMENINKNKNEKENKIIKKSQNKKRRKKEKKLSSILNENKANWFVDSWTIEWRRFCFWRATKASLMYRQPCNFPSLFHLFHVPISHFCYFFICKNYNAYWKTHSAISIAISFVYHYYYYSIWLFHSKQ